MPASAGVVFTDMKQAFGLIDQGVGLLFARLFCLMGSPLWISSQRFGRAGSIRWGAPGSLGGLDLGHFPSLDLGQVVLEDFVERSHQRNAKDHAQYPKKRTANNDRNHDIDSRQADLVADNPREEDIGFDLLDNAQKDQKDQALGR